MHAHDIIVVGASAGGVEAIQTIVRGLPHDLPAAVFVVLHLSPHGTSALPQILARAGKVPARHATDRERFEHGRIYVAPPDHHLIVKRGYVRVTRGPQENSARPAIDALFRTAARAYGPRVVAVLLTGNLDDGTAGIAAVKQTGGVAIVQDPEEALYPGMPFSAIENVADINHILSVADMSPLLARLAREPAAPGDVFMVDDELEQEADMAELEPSALHTSDRPGEPSAFSCPHCHGTLFELQESKLTRFRCRVGHAFSPDSLLAAHSESVEAALWVALRALEEKVALLERLEKRIRSRRGPGARLADTFETQRRDTQRHAETLRKLLPATGSASVTIGPTSAMEQMKRAPESGATK
jgi:two-component system chemotaxis response regulator CheB